MESVEQIFGNVLRDKEFSYTSWYLKRFINKQVKGSCFESNNNKLNDQKIKPLEWDIKYSLEVDKERKDAWLAYCGQTCEALAAYRQNSCCIKIVDCEKVTNLIYDIREMTTHIPYKGKEVDMTVDLARMLSKCQTNGDLAPLFR